MEHRVHEQWESSREHTSQESVRSDGRGGEFLERVNEVVERRLEDGEEAETHADQTDHGRNPVDGLGGSPAEDEKPA